jgi:hypothetical protein
MALLPHVEQALVVYMQDCTIAGQPRTRRRYSPYDNCRLPTMPPGSCLYQDKGFQRFFLPGMTIFGTKKTLPGGELTPPEKETNRRISCIRIRIEHAIGGVKHAES